MAENDQNSSISSSSSSSSSDDDGTLENRLQRDDWEIRLIKDVACDMYFHPSIYTPKAFSIAHEMVFAMLTWGCETSYAYILAGAVQYCASHKFVVVPVSNMILTEQSMLPFIPKIQFCWSNFLRGEDYSVLSTNFRLQLGPRTYILRLDHFAPLTETHTVTIYFWCEGSEEETGRGRAILRMEIVERFIRQRKWLWFAFYIATEMSSAFYHKLRTARENEYEHCRQCKEPVSPCSEPDISQLSLKDDDDPCYSDQYFDTQSRTLEWARLV